MRDYASSTPMRHPFSCRDSKYGLDPASRVAMISICGYSSVRSIHSGGIASTPARAGGRGGQDYEMKRRGGEVYHICLIK